MLADATRSRPTILVIDDSAEFRNLLRVALTLEGYEVVEASDGDKGLRLFDECRPHLVLLDMVMPEKDGIETLREIMRRRPGTPVITVSGHTGAEEFNEAAVLLGARRGFTKAFGVEDLLDAIRAYFAQSAPANLRP